MFVRNYANKTFDYDINSYKIVQKEFCHKSTFRVGLILDSAIATPPTTGLTYKVHYLSLAMVNRGHYYTFYICNRNFTDEQSLLDYQLPNIKVHVIDEHLFYNVEYMEQVLKNDHIDILQFEVPQTFLDIGVEIKKNMCLPAVLVLHDIEDEFLETLGNKKQDNDLLDYVHYISGHLADSVLTLTNVDREKRIQKHSILPEKIFVSPMGLDSSINYKGPNIKDNVILFVGNLFHEPNRRAVNFLIKHILPKVIKVHSDAKVKIIGMGSEELKRHYKENEHIIFLGEIRDEGDYLHELSTGTVGTCCVDSGCGMNAKIASYGAVGLPIVLTPLGHTGYESITSLIVTDFDAEMIAREIIDLLSNKRKAKHIGRQNNMLMSKYLSWENVAVSMERANLYAYRCVKGKIKCTVPNMKPLWFVEKRHRRKVLKGHYVINNKEIFQYDV